MSAWWLLLIVPISIFVGFCIGVYTAWHCVKYLGEIGKKVGKFFDGLSAKMNNPIDIDCEVL